MLGDTLSHCVIEIDNHIFLKTIIPSRKATRDYLQDLGISHVEEIKSGFPDAIAMQSIGNGKYKRIRIEFEFRSSSFLRHGHSIDGCDLIVCWIHDWPECPLDVIELSSSLFEQSA